MEADAKSVATAAAFLADYSRAPTDKLTYTQWLNDRN